MAIFCIGTELGPMNTIIVKNSSKLAQNDNSVPLSTLEGRNPLRARYLAASFWAQNFLKVGKYEAAILTDLVLLIDDSPIMFLHNPPTDMYS